MVDFYTSKLFGNIQCKSRNAFPFCSAMNTQIGVDVDGSMYPCHGAITSPRQKPFLWFGNLFEGILSYQKVIKNISYQFGSIWSRAKCTSCPLHHYTTGNVCWDCAPHNLELTGEPSTDGIMKCIAFSESLPYWTEIAKMVYNNPILKEIPDKYKYSKEEYSKLKKLNIMPENMHYDRDYDGILDRAVRKVCCLDNKEDYGYTQYADAWWKFDDFFNLVEKEKCK